MFDWTDAAHPKEIAYFDRGPMDSTKAGPMVATGQPIGITATCWIGDLSRDGHLRAQA